MFQPDVLFAPFCFATIGEAFGSSLHHFTDQPPTVRRPAVRTAAELMQLPVPNLDTCPQILYLRESIRMMAARFKDHCPIAAVLPPSPDLPSLIMGIEGWLDVVLFDVVAARQVLAKMTTFFVNLANSLFADGATFIVLPCGFASPAVVTRETVALIIRPALADALAQLSGPTVIHHVGAPLLSHLDLLTGLPSVAGYALDSRDDIGRARQIVGPEPVIFGGPAGTSLSRMTTDQVVAACGAILKAAAGDQRFALYTPGPDIPLGSAPANISAIKKAAEAWQA
jgi:uroporphyrinogen decarboxylase